MKPSERRALLEKKRAEKEAEAQRRAEAAAYGDETNESVDYIKPIKPTASRYIPFLGKKERAESEDKVEKKEGFFSKHVMLITGIIASLVVICGVVFGIDYLKDFVNDNQFTVYNDGVDISMAEVNILHDNFYAVQWRHLEGFNYTDYSYTKKGGKYILREYPIEGTELVVRMGGPENQKEPDFIYVRDYESGEYIDISVDDPRYFFDERGYTVKEDD